MRQVYAVKVQRLPAQSSTQRGPVPISTSWLIGVQHMNLQGTFHFETITCPFQKYSRTIDQYPLFHLSVLVNPGHLGAGGSKDLATTTTLSSAARLEGMELSNMSRAEYLQSPQPPCLAPALYFSWEVKAGSTMCGTCHLHPLIAEKLQSEPRELFREQFATSTLSRYLSIIAMILMHLKASYRS